MIADSGLVPVHGRGLGQAGLGRPGGAGHRTARPAPHDPAVPVRLPDLGAGAHRADLRLHPPPGGVRPQAEAGPRLLRDAAAGRRPAGRPGRPGPRGHAPWWPGRSPWTAPKAVARGGPGAARRRRAGWLRRRARRAGRPHRSCATAHGGGRRPATCADRPPGSLAGRPLTGSRGSSPASRRPRPPSWSAAAASPGCCARGSSRCSRR